VLGTEARDRGDGGAPAGWAGWRSRLGAGRVADLGFVAGLVEVAFARGAALGRDASWARADASFFGCGAAVTASVLAGRAARLSLRRCGRRCGRAERTSDEEEFWSVIARFRRC